jgi:hypothetical protein
MKTTLPSLTERRPKTDADWLKTPYPNLIRYRPSGTYFGRVRVNGKLIRRSLETHVLSVAKVKLSDFLQDYRRLAINKGQSVKGEVIIELFSKEIEDDANNQPRTKLYKREVLIALKKTWPELYSSEIARISQKDCNDWAARRQGLQPHAIQRRIRHPAPNFRHRGGTWLPGGQSSQVRGLAAGEAEGIASAVPGTISGDGRAH